MPKIPTGEVWETFISRWCYRCSTQMGVIGVTEVVDDDRPSLIMTQIKWRCPKCYKREV